MIMPIYMERRENILLVIKKELKTHKLVPARVVSWCFLYSSALYITWKYK